MKGLPGQPAREEEEEEEEEEEAAEDEVVVSGSRIRRTRARSGLPEAGKR